MKLVFALVLISFSLLFTFGQVPIVTGIQILKAEDARRYDGTLETLMRSPIVAVKTRAALAAGRIGDERALPILTSLLVNDTATSVRSMAAFAIGEIESIKSAAAILKALTASEAETRPVGSVSSLRARLVEAAGKIAAANPKEERAKELGNAILAALDAEYAKGTNQNREVVLLGLTAALRAKPEKAEVTVAKFLSSADARIRADAANTLSRIRAKNANETLRAMLVSEPDDVARANAARALGAAEDKDALNILLNAATTDKDSRVRVSAIRALGSIKDAKAADKLLERGETLLGAYKQNLKPNFVPAEQNEFLEISTALGQILAKTGNARAIALFRDFAKVDKFRTAEPYIARVKVGGIRPGAGLGDDAPAPTEWRQYSTLLQVIGELAAYEPESPEAKKIKDEAPEQIRKLAKAFINADPKLEPEAVMAAPDALQAFARFRTDDLGEIARTALQSSDVQTRAAAAGILADLAASKENLDALKSAFTKALLTDTKENDAQLTILAALFKLDKRESIPILWSILDAKDYLLRKKALELLKETQKDPKLANVVVEAVFTKKRDQLSPYTSGSKLGVILNKDADYRRALSRKDGSVKAVLTTEKGTFTIDFYPEHAPLTVDNFIKLARSGYFNGLEVHRVVPNFVMQDGDPRGDGNGGPGWSIRCEVNMLAYERGAVGMALSGKDTGGSQWFVTHAPQPHLDGGYTVFGHVNETDMKVVDNIVRGDRVISVNIIEGNLTQRTRGTQRKKRLK